MVDLMIILCHLKSDIFYCIGGCKLVENVLLCFIFFLYLKMSYCFSNRHELLHKAKGRYHNCGGKKSW